MDLLDSSVNLICSCGLNHRQFRTFSANIWSESRDGPYRNLFRRLSRGRVLSRLSAPRKEIDAFLHEKINLCL